MSLISPSSPCFCSGYLPHKACARSFSTAAVAYLGLSTISVGFRAGCMYLLRRVGMMCSFSTTYESGMIWRQLVYCVRAAIAFSCGSCSRLLQDVVTPQSLLSACGTVCDWSGRPFSSGQHSSQRVVYMHGSAICQADTVE